MFGPFGPIRGSSLCRAFQLHVYMCRDENLVNHFLCPCHQKPALFMHLAEAAFVNVTVVKDLKQQHY